LIELRRRLGETQQSMAVRLNVALQSISRWETVTEPQGVTLWRLWELAREHGYDDLRAVFQAALDKFKQTDRHKAEDVLNDVERWRKIQAGLIELMEIGMSLGDTPPGPRIAELAGRVGALTDQARMWSWKNR
jgi:hypothetical protein